MNGYTMKNQHARRRAPQITRHESRCGLSLLRSLLNRTDPLFFTLSPSHDGGLIFLFSLHQPPRPSDESIDETAWLIGKVIKTKKDTA